MSHRDGAGRLLALAVRLLPAARRDWGAAMRAELDGIDAPGERWRFSRGCTRVIVTRPATWRHLGYPLLILAGLIAAWRYIAPVEYPPLRHGLIGLVAALVLVAALGRVRPLGPVADSRAARGVRAAGYLLIGTLATAATRHVVTHNQHDASGVPLVAVLLVGYLLGFLALTRHWSAATGRTIRTGALAGTAGAAAWTATVFTFPPIPPRVGLALMFIIVAVAAAATLTGRRGDTEAGVLAATTAGTVAALLILASVLILSSYGPARLIPDLVPAALSPADDLANSRTEIQDPYLWMVLIGWLAALAQSLAALTTPRGKPIDIDAAPAWDTDLRATAPTDRPV